MTELLPSAYDEIVQLAQLGNDFVVQDGDFSVLDIRAGAEANNFHYFVDSRTNRFIKNFVLDDGPQVATLCNVTLIKKDDGYSPRIRLWKRDKTKGKASTTPVQEMIPDIDSTRQIKASVDTGTCHKNFWTLIHYLQSLKEVSLPDNNFRVVTTDSAQLASLLQCTDKRTAIDAFKAAMGSDLTEADIALLGNRMARLQQFERLLTDETYFNEQSSDLTQDGAEAVWQRFFEDNPWIFGYGLNLISCRPIDNAKLEQATTGANIFGGGGKRIDALMRSNGWISSLLFCEIKTSKTDLVAPKQYRKPDVYRPSADLTGGVAQVQKTVHKAMNALEHELHRLYASDGTPTGIQVSTVKPKQVLVIGTLDRLKDNGEVNPEKLSSFELYRRSIVDVEIVTFDELYERARFIVRDN